MNGGRGRDGHPRGQSGLAGSRRRATQAASNRVLVVDDDVTMGSALRRLFRSAGIESEHFESGTDFLDRADFSPPACIVLDLRMPGMDGLAVQGALKEREIDLPVVFLTGSAAIQDAVTAMRAGAADFIEKPFENQDLLDRVSRLLAACAREHASHSLQHDHQERFNQLTPRESQVLSLLVKGLTNKEIAHLLGTSYRTVEIQRARIMERMQADSLADLVRMHIQVYG